MTWFRRGFAQLPALLCVFEVVQFKLHSWPFVVLRKALHLENLACCNRLLHLIKS